MTSITIRRVPEEAHDVLAARAAAAGKSLQEYLLGELTRLAARPTVDEVVARARHRAETVGGGRVSRRSILEARDADRR
jgi:hypothetical protein